MSAPARQLAERLAEELFERDYRRDLTIDLIAIKPFSGQAQASRVVIDAVCGDEDRCSFEPPTPGGSPPIEEAASGARG